MQKLNGQIFALLHKGGVKERDERLRLLGGIICRPVTSFTDLTYIEVQAVAAALRYWDGNGELAQRCLEMTRSE